MIRLSVDVIWSSLVLLKRVSEYNIRTSEEMYIRNFNSACADALMEMALSCCWIYKVGDWFVLSERGRIILNAQGFSDQAKLILSDYIHYLTPSWAKRIPHGRQEAFIFMTKDEQACFQEAGLMGDNPDVVAVSWWDHVSYFLRMADDDKKTEIGRRGEYLTIQYEQRRTGRKPQWISIDSNLSGYDLISQLSKETSLPLLIEVKSSEKSIDAADFFVSTNEWHTACNSDNYKFYLWCFFGKRNQLAIIHPQQLIDYIPTNNKSGEWQVVRIPFVSFIEEFREVI